jgi:tetratricopeptide (TPR) repeat protein
MFMKQNGDELEAINLLNKLEKQGFKRSVVQEEKATIYHNLGNRKAAHSSLSAAARSDVRNLDALQKLAVYQLEEGEYQEALLGLNRVINRDPARFTAYLQRAEARSGVGDLEGAREDLDLYVLYFPDDEDAHYRKGMIEFTHGKYLNAIQSFNKALELNSGVAEYYLARGRTYASTGTTRYADRDMSMALDLDPYNGETWFEKGKLSEKLGDVQSACHCYKKALQFGIAEALELINNQCR